MKKLLTILIILAFCAVAYASVTTDSDLIVIAGRVNPGDTVDDFYLAAIGGRWLPPGDHGSGSRMIIWLHHHH